MLTKKYFQCYLPVYGPVVARQGIWLKGCPIFFFETFCVLGVVCHYEPFLEAFQAKIFFFGSILVTLP